LVEQLNELREIGQRAREPIDLVDDDHIDLARPDICQQALQGRAIGIAA
jgi:hypothetical protein